MPATVANETVNNPLAVIWNLTAAKSFPEYYDLISGETVPSRLRLTDEYHLTETGTNFRTSESSRRLIHAEKRFLSQLSDYSSLIERVRISTLLESMRKSLSALISINPTQFDLEVTSEDSIYYTAKINSYTIYLQHYLVLEIGDEDEIVFSVFENKKNIFNYAGKLNQSFARLSDFFTKDNILQDNLNHALSC